MTIHGLIDILHIPINHIEVEGNIIHIGSVGTCVMRGNTVSEFSLNWQKIYELNKVQLADLIREMYQVKVDELDITAKPNRILELKFQGTEMTLPSIQYTYHTSGEWTLIRAV